MLHADVAGSTEMVQANEQRAHLDIQRTLRSLSSVVEKYGGQTREVRGDALVAEFSRASDAVCAALCYQSSQDLQDDNGVRLRVGIALGEVVVADGTVTGAGVVLAQRLEQLASDGGVVLQGAVRDATPQRLPIHYEPLGERNFKGFDEPVRAFAVQLPDGEKAPGPTPPATSMADNLSSDDDPRPVICFVDDDPVELQVFERVFGDRYRIFASTNLADVTAEMRRNSVVPNLIVLDLYFPTGRDSTAAERAEMIRLKQRVDDAQQELTSYLVQVGQGREGGLKLLSEARERVPGVPITFLTRKGTIDDVIACLEAGAVHVLKKPQPQSIDPDSDLLPQLERAADLSKHALATQLDRLLGSTSTIRKAVRAMSFVRQNWSRF
jgi:CheY-like chemotaxis protein